MPMFDDYADTIKKWFTAGGSWTPPTSVKFLLSSTVPLSDGTNITTIGAGLTNPATVTCSTGNFDAPAGGATANTNLIDFGTATGAATVNAVVIRDQADNNICFIDISGSPLEISTDDPVQAAAGAITITIGAGSTGNWFNYFKHMLLSAIFRAQSLTQPTSRFTGFSTTTPAVDGTNITEPAGAWYSQQSLTCNGTNFDNTISGGDPITNLVAMSFGNSDETVVITDIVTYDHLGNKLTWDAWSKTIQNGQPVSVEIGQLSDDFN